MLHIRGCLLANRVYSVVMICSSPFLIYWWFIWQNANTDTTQLNTNDVPVPSSLGNFFGHLTNPLGILSAQLLYFVQVSKFHQQSSSPKMYAGQDNKNENWNMLIPNLFKKWILSEYLFPRPKCIELSQNISLFFWIFWVKVIKSCRCVKMEKERRELHYDHASQERELGIILQIAFAGTSLNLWVLLVV